MKYGFTINIGAVETEDFAFEGARVDINTEMTIGEFTAVASEARKMLKEAPALIGEMAKTFRKYQNEFDREDNAKAKAKEMMDKLTNNIRKAPVKADIPEHLQVLAKVLGINPENIMKVEL